MKRRFQEVKSMTESLQRIAMEEVTDPAELARSNPRNARFARNLAWFERHAPEIASHRGKCICIAGEELFAAATPDEALALARAAHPDDDGFFLHYLYREKAERIYGHTRAVAVV
jgi:hypothetical protein